MRYFKSLTTIFLATALSTYSTGMENKSERLEIQNEDHTKTGTPTEWKDQLCLAAITGNLDEIQSLYKTNSAVFTGKDLFGDNVLHVAAAEGHLEVVKFLYEQNKTLLKEKNLCGYNALHSAARKGHLEVVKFLYEQNKSLLKEKSIAGQNALHIAALEGNLEVVKFIIETCPELLNETCQNGKFPFMYAQENKHTELAKYMIVERLKLAQKSIPDTKILINEAPKTITPQQTGIQKKESKVTVTESQRKEWFLAVKEGNLDKVKYLYKIMPEMLPEKNDMGINALIFASYNKRTEIVKFLSQQNKDILLEKCNYGNNALHIAAYNGQLDIVKLLYQQNNALITEKDADGSNALLIAIINEHLDVANFLYEKDKSLLMGINIDGHSILHIAAYKGQLEVVKFIIETCPELLNETCQNGKFPFMYAQASNHIELAKYMIVERLKLAQKSIPDTKVSILEAPQAATPKQMPIQNKECKVTVTKSQSLEWSLAINKGNLNNIKSLYNKTPSLLMTKNLSGANALHMAALKGNIEIVKFLCDENEALLTEKTTEGVNALYIAAQMGHLEVVKILYNIDKSLPKEKTPNVANALFIAIKMGKLEVVKFLCEQNNTLLKEKAPNGGNILHIAAQGGNLELFQYLYTLCESNNFLLEEKAPNGGNILHIAAQKGFLEIVKFLYERNYSHLKEKTPDGCSALHTAAQGGALEVVKFLHEKNNLVLKEKTRDGRNALHIAASWGHDEVVKFLIKTCPELLTEKCNNGKFPFIDPRNDKERELGEFITSERNKLARKVNPVANSVGKISNSKQQKKNSIPKEDGKFSEKRDFDGISNAKLKEMYEKSLGQNELAPSNPKREQMIAHLLKKNKMPSNIDKSTNNNSVILSANPTEIINSKGVTNNDNNHSNVIPDVSLKEHTPINEHQKPELKNTELTQIIENQELNNVDNPDISKKSKKTKTFRNPIKAATDYMKSKVQSREEKEIEKRERNKIKVQSKDDLGEKSHSTKSTKDTSSISESYLCITDSQSEWEKSLVSQSEGPLDEITEQVKICYPQFYKLIKKSKAQFLSQVKLNSSLDIRVTLEWLKKYCLIDGTIKHDKIHVNKAGNKDCVFISHTTHGAGTHSKWYHDPAVIVSFLTFVANCDPLLRDYLISQFGVHCFSRELDNEDEKFNISLKKDSEKFGDDAREEGEG